MVQCNNCIIGGDLNTSLHRLKSDFTPYLCKIVEREHLCLFIKDNVSDIGGLNSFFFIELTITAVVGNE